MKRFAVLAASVALATLWPAAASGLRADPVDQVRLGVATNWAGYVAQSGRPFTSASTTWTEPSISCPPRSNSAFASFAGIDGLGSPTVEQIGTFSTCQNGSVAHFAFYEMFPSPPGSINHPVKAGDTLTATVSVPSAGLFNLTLSSSEGWTFSTQQSSSRAQLASAEAITEAPTIVGSGVVKLANFGTVNYNGTTANGQQISSFGPTPVTMEKRTGLIKATPSGLSGGSFSVTWRHS
ncbi:MAG: hypothetical protein JOZ04_04380 [Acidimicrobiia bacterium]|nr:hypothetical protein [Acidimicrobiia bacterium]